MDQKDVQDIEEQWDPPKDDEEPGNPTSPPFEQRKRSDGRPQGHQQE
jgi:hypothetical protein